MNFLEVMSKVSAAVESVKKPVDMNVEIKTHGGWSNRAFKTENFPTIEIEMAAFSGSRDTLVIDAVKKAVKGDAVILLGWTMSKNSFKTSATYTTGWWVLPGDYKKRG